MKIKIFFFLIAVITQAQFQREFVDATIHFKNHEILQGYIFDDFKQNDWYGKFDSDKTAIVGETMNYPTTTSSFQTIIKTILYKANADDGQQTPYDSKDIDFIIVNRNGQIQKYITTNVVRGNYKGLEEVKFDTLNRNIWLPVKKEGKINMYGYYNWTIKKRNGWGEIYFQRNGEDFSINPILSHKLATLNGQRMLIKASLLKIFNDCPEFKQNIEQIIDEYINDFHKARQLTAEERKLIKSQSKKERDRFEFELKEKKSFVPYENILKKYNNYCDN